MAAAGTGDPVCRLCAMATRVSGGRRARTGGRILENATQRGGGAGTAERPSPAGEAQLSGRPREGRDRPRRERGAETAEPERGRDAVYGADGGLQGALDEIQRRGGCGRRDGDRQPNPERG